MTISGTTVFTGIFSKKVLILLLKLFNANCTLILKTQKKIVCQCMLYFYNLMYLEILNIIIYCTYL